jgi:hypothetical protein
MKRYMLWEKYETQIHSVNRVQNLVMLKQLIYEYARTITTGLWKVNNGARRGNEDIIAISEYYKLSACVNFVSDDKIILPPTTVVGKVVTEINAFLRNIVFWDMRP